jgi:hypothetical protein
LIQTFQATDAAAEADDEAGEGPVPISRQPGSGLGEYFFLGNHRELQKCPKTIVEIIDLRKPWLFRRQNLHPNIIFLEAGPWILFYSKSCCLGV